MQKITMTPEEKKLMLEHIFSSASLEEELSEDFFVSKAWKNLLNQIQTRFIDPLHSMFSLFRK